MRSHLVLFLMVSVGAFFGISFPSETSADTRQFGYSNVVPGLELFPLRTLPPTPSRPVGSLETFVVELDEAQQIVRFQVTVARHLTADLPNGFAVVMNGGGMPGGSGKGGRVGDGAGERGKAKVEEGEGGAEGEAAVAARRREKRKQRRKARKARALAEAREGRMAEKAHRQAIAKEEHEKRCAGESDEPTQRQSDTQDGETHRITGRKTERKID